MMSAGGTVLEPSRESMAKAIKDEYHSTQAREDKGYTPPDNDDINPLYVYMQPKHLPSVLQQLKNISFLDRLIFKYHPYPTYSLAREYFLDHPEYTHLILHPNDIIVTRVNVLQLIDDIKKYEYDNISGVSNVDLELYQNHWAFCQELPKIAHEERVFPWVKMDEDKGIRQVKHSGFQLFAMSRRVLKKFDIAGDELYLPGVPPGFSTDLVWSHQMAAANIPIYVDTRINMFHLRYEGEMLAGKLGKQVLFKPKGAIYP